MKNFKKMMAIVIVAVMTLMYAVPSFAANGNLTADSSVTISGLENGDKVNLYKVFEWGDTYGWTLTGAFNVAPVKDLPNIKKIVENDTTNTPIQLSKNTLEELAKVAKDLAPSPTGTANSSGVYSWSNPSESDAGMYMALIEPAKAGTIYNPLVVSVDFKNNTSNSIDASKTPMGSDSTVAKKDTVKVEKEASDYTHKTNDYVQFTVTTTIPVFAKSYTNPTFNVSDTLSPGLKGVINTSDHKFEVSAGDVTYIGAPNDGFAEFKLVFDSDKIKALNNPQLVTIKYWAQVTTDAPYSVNEEKNDVTVEFSNNPRNNSDFDYLYDETRHWTFDIDGSLFGNSTYKTGEAVKIGVDEDGNILESVVQLSNGSSHGALADAVFGLYKAGTTEFTDANLVKTKEYPEGVKVTTTSDGLMTIKGLDEGTYILKEISAPKGYIKDNKSHNVVITANYTEKPYSKVIDGKTVNYKVKTLDSYTITIDGNESSYEMTLSGPQISSVTPGDSSTEIRNTKGVELPSTGGMGTTLFYIIGAILVILAGVLLVTRRRAHVEE